MELEKENARLSGEIGIAQSTIDINNANRSKMDEFIGLVATFERLNFNNLQLAMVQLHHFPDEAIHIMKKLVSRAYGIPVTPERIGGADRRVNPFQKGLL